MAATVNQKASCFSSLDDRTQHLGNSEAQMHCAQGISYAKHDILRIRFVPHFFLILSSGYPSLPVQMEVSSHERP
jgi:hypothetical protein